MADPWFKFYASDWLAGTRGLTAAETGIYITLIAMMYERGEAIPRDDTRLSRLCGCPKASFTKALNALLVEGKVTEDEGRLSNPRVEKERQCRVEKSQKASASAKKRWDTLSEKNEQKQWPVDANAYETQCEPNANQKPEPDSSSSGRERKAIDSGSKADRLYDHVLAAVGLISGVIPHHWMPPAATIHVWRWHTELEIPIDQIVAAARNSRARHADPPAGPKALDRVMQSLAAELRSKPMTPKVINGGQYEQSSRHPNRLQRIVTAAAEGTSGQDWG